MTDQGRPATPAGGPAKEPIKPKLIKGTSRFEITPRAAPAPASPQPPPDETPTVPLAGPGVPPPAEAGPPVGPRNLRAVLHASNPVPVDPILSRQRPQETPAQAAKDVLTHPVSKVVGALALIVVGTLWLFPFPWFLTSQQDALLAAKRRNKVLLLVRRTADDGIQYYKDVLTNPTLERESYLFFQDFMTRRSSREDPLQVSVIKPDGKPVVMLLPLRDKRPPEDHVRDLVAWIRFANGDGPAPEAPAPPPPPEPPPEPEYTEPDYGEGD